MKIENQVCTKEQGLRLEQLGIAHKSIFCYCRISTSPEDSYDDLLPTDWNLEGLPDSATTWTAPAFTVAELGVMLSYYYPSYQSTGIINFYCSYLEDGKMQGYTGVGDTEAQARAAMLIYLLENNQVTTEEVNKRLINK